jgi:dephospho-CoA kinase
MTRDAVPPAGVSGRGKPTGAHRTVRIGLTGPIGCGKSTVAGWLAARGAVTIDADAVARDVVAPGEPALALVLERFGDAVLAPDGSLDRAALGRIVFADPSALRDLEAIVHPAVRPRILAAISAAEAAGSRAVVIEAIRLVEGGLAALCDEVWLVTCAPGEQRARLLARGMASVDADQRIAVQEGLVERVRDTPDVVVIDSSGSREQTVTAVEAAYGRALGTGAAGYPESFRT